MRNRAARQFLAIALTLGCGRLAAAPVPTDLSPSAAVADATPAAVSPAAAAFAPDELPPQAPGAPEGAFNILTRSGQSPVPVLRLRWTAAEAGDFLVQGYHVFRSGPEGVWERRDNGGRSEVPLNAVEMEDPVEVGQVYEYSVAAVDVKGRVGPRSAVYRVDLSQLPSRLLAPPAPEALTATSRRDDVLLQWQQAPAWIAPISGYQVFSADSQAGLASAVPVMIGETSYVDTPATLGKLRWYAVASVDAAGRVSPASVTVSGQATGVLPPGAPLGLTTKARTEKVALAWQAPEPGTGQLSGYLLSRRAFEDDEWDEVARLPAGRTDYTDKAPGDRGYLYALRAFDSDANTGPAAYVGASPTAKLWNKTLVVLMPTAYANLKDRDRGLNLNVLFDFFVGSLYETYENPLTGQNKSGLFQPLQIATVTTDTKWALLDDRGLIPGLAAGLYISALINFGQPTGAQTVGISSTGGGINTLGNVYAVLSKRFWPGEPRAAIHAGVFLGGLADGLAGEQTPEDWRLTVRHLTPGGDYTNLLSRMVDPKLGAQLGQAPHLAFAGLQFPFTVPLFFTKWHTGLRLEAMVPLPVAANYPASSTGQAPPSADPNSQLPWLLNVHMDNLPLFGFEFGFFSYPGGFQLIAFYHIPDLTWAW